ncbi:DUF1826 domain-containing protein [Lentisphaera profundi]|uniref:DUF1826 domain-containing protein n=1 Tax=Lentisphaera profundi TaxID=1658616 RepID=A0ABY7VWA6_9BACT|nr:DUF1826 domain-containing protein [Lentisphaera profundi]WDE97544.1 DUF1826 domain-containing protein [Lentisphaera profundi]
MVKTKSSWSQGYEIINDTVSLSSVRNLVVPQNDMRGTSFRHIETQNSDDKTYRLTARSVREIKAFATNALLSLGYNDFSTFDQIENLAEKMFIRLKTNYLKCRMDLVSSDSCKKFHMDNLMARAITTLIGPGTEYKFSKKPCQVYQVKTGDTIILKGGNYPGKKSKILHRSPKISHLGIERLVFVMDC